MGDYYEILGLSQSADASQIKAAYKRLAMLYHPDRNMGDKQAEEMFKRINEAYHFLSDPIKKSRYDSRFYTAPAPSTEDYFRREYERRRNYPPRQTQQRYYKIDKNYFKVQGLAILVFFVFASICFGVAHTVSYVIEKKQMAKWMANTRLLKQVNGLFDSGRFTEAFDMVSSLKTQDPTEFRFIYAGDSLVSALSRMADARFKEGNYSVSIQHLLILKNYENPIRLETLRKIAFCQYHLGNYEEAVRALKHLHNQQPGNFELIYQIGMINQEKLGNSQEALQYFDLGKSLFKKNLTEVYGEAFEMVMNPMDAPDIYYEMFVGRAKANLDLNHYADAITDGNWAIYLRRSKPDGYYLRALAKARSQSYSDLCDDLREARRLGSKDAPVLQKRYCR